VEKATHTLCSTPSYWLAEDCRIALTTQLLSDSGFSDQNLYLLIRYCNKGIGSKKIIIEAGRKMNGDHIDRTSRLIHERRFTDAIVLLEERGFVAISYFPFWVWVNFGENFLSYSVSVRQKGCDHPDTSEITLDSGIEALYRMVPFPQRRIMRTYTFCNTVIKQKTNPGVLTRGAS